MTAIGMLHIVLLISSPIVSGVTTVAYGVCFSACAAYFAGNPAAWSAAMGAATTPVGVAAVVAGTMGVGAACAASCACFDVETIVQTKRNGMERLASVQAGDEVLTLDDRGVPVYTQVKWNAYVPGNFSFRTIILQEYQRNLTTTETHPVCLGVEGKCHPTAARNVVVGQQLAVSPGGKATVAAILSSYRLGKIALETESCTVIANGVLTGTVCNDTKKWAATRDAESLAEGLLAYGKLDVNNDGFLSGDEIFSSNDMSRFQALLKDYDAEYDFEQVDINV